MAIRYRFKVDNSVSRSMSQNAVLQKLISSDLDRNCELQRVGEDWYPISKHPDFHTYFDKSHSDFKKLNTQKENHIRTLRMKKVKRASRTTGIVIVSVLVLTFSYFALQSGLFNMEYDPFVGTQRNDMPVPAALLEQLDNAQPELERQALLSQSAAVSQTANPEKIDALILQLQRHVVQFPQDEDVVFWYLLLRCLQLDGTVPNNQWMEWIDRTTIRVDKLARLQAWVALKRGHVELVLEAVRDCDQNDTVCQAAKWIAQGDLQTALTQAQAGEAFAWRALLDITNDSDRLEHHLQVAKELETQWPQSDVPYRLRMDLAIDQKDWTAAYELRNKIKADDPDTAAAILKLALINQDYRGARNVNAQGEMNHPEVMFLRASALIQAGQYAEGKRLLKEAIPKGLGVEAQLLLARAHAGLNELEDARAIYARNVNDVRSRSQRFYAVYLGALLRNFRTAGQLMVDFPTEEPEYWFLALHTAIVRQGPQQALESIEGLAQTDIRLLWTNRMEDAWMPAIDRAGMGAAAKSLIGQLRSVGDANVLVDWGLQLDNASQSVLSLQAASAANSSAKSFAAFESGNHELAISEADVALRFEANPDWISTVKAISLLKAGSTSRGASAMDAIVSRKTFRANARLLSIGAKMRQNDAQFEEFLAMISPITPPQYFMKIWPKSPHRLLNGF